MQIKVGFNVKHTLTPQFYICTYKWYSFSKIYHVRKLINQIFILHFTPLKLKSPLMELSTFYTYNVVKKTKEH